jgi:hypothetical protein
LLVIFVKSTEIVSVGGHWRQATVHRPAFRSPDDGFGRPSMELVLAHA